MIDFLLGGDDDDDDEVLECRGGDTNKVTIRINRKQIGFLRVQPRILVLPFVQKEEQEGKDGWRSLLNLNEIQLIAEEGAIHLCSLQVRPQ